MHPGPHDVEVLGAGLAGLVAAWEAQRRGQRVRLWERRDTPGGLARSFSHRAHRFDAGAHRIHNQGPAYEALLTDELGLDLHPVDAPSGVHSEGTVFAFPPRPRQLLLSEGPLGAPAIALDWLRARASVAPAADLESTLVHRFGRRLSDRFLLPYNAKLWGLPPARLDGSAATSRLQGLGLARLVLELARIPPA